MMKANPATRQRVPNGAAKQGAFDFMLYSTWRGTLPQRRLAPAICIVGLVICALCWAISSSIRQTSAQGQCKLGCKPSAPATAKQNAPVAFNAEATTEDCDAAPAYEWDFGDGSPRVAAQTAEHQFPLPGTYNWRLTASTAVVDTVAGGYGENASARQAAFATPAAVAVDPQGRGFYVSDLTPPFYTIRFVNTTHHEVVIGNQKIAAGAVQRLVGGGLLSDDNLPGRRIDPGAVTAIAPSADGNLIYWLDAGAPSVRVFNASGQAQTACGKTIDPGNAVKVVTDGLSYGVSGITVNPVTEDVYVLDSGVDTNKVFRIGCNNALATVAGNGTLPRKSDPFVPGAATALLLYQPRAIAFDKSGNLYIADTGHARIIKVDATGQASLVAQLSINQNPFVNGLAFVGNDLYAAMGNQQTIARVTNQTTIVAGKAGMACHPDDSNCGDGGAARDASLSLTGSTGEPPIVGIGSDSNGLFIPDQGIWQRGRIRYLNLSANPVTVFETTIAPGSIDTVAGSGLPPPSDGGLAISATLYNPPGVAVDANGNLFIADTYASKLRFVNRGSTAVKVFAGTPAEQTVPPGVIIDVNKNINDGPGDGGPVNFAVFDIPQGLTVTKQGLFIADSKRGSAILSLKARTGSIRFVNTSAEDVTFYADSPSPLVVPPGNVATIAGGGLSVTNNGDGGFALSARFIAPTDVAVHPATGDIYTTSVFDKSVRRINARTGIVTSLTLPPAQYTGLTFDKDGRLYIANPTDGLVLRELSSGSRLFARMNAAYLYSPRDVAVDAAGNAYVTEAGSLQSPIRAFGNRIARISPDGQVTTAAGAYEPGFDDGQAINARINLRVDDLVISIWGQPPFLPTTIGLAISANNELFFCDPNNNRIRRVTGLSEVCVQSGSIVVVGETPPPQLNSLSPYVARVGDAGLTLVAEGSNFALDAKVLWNGDVRPTTYVNNSKLLASITVGDLSQAGLFKVAVLNPSSGGGASQPQNFLVKPQQNPAPVLKSIEPGVIIAGANMVTLVVKGENFLPESRIRWNGVSLRTTFVSTEQLITTVSGDLIARSGTAQIIISTPSPGGGNSASRSLRIAPR